MHLIKFICWSYSLYVLAFAAVLIDHQAHGLTQNSADQKNHEDTNDHIQTHHSSSSHHHMDQSTLVFFTLNDLKLGKSLPIYFRGTNNHNNSPKFLPREEANLILFKLSKLPYLLHYFGFSQGSSQANAMQNTLRECEVKPIKGETKFCATSLESMLNFVHEMLGTNPKVLATKTFDNNNLVNVLQNFTIVDEPREIPAPKMVACHTMPYPYVIYYCHYQETLSKVFKVSLKANNVKSQMIDAVAVCHMDTSQWSEKHVSFKVLGIKPGVCPVCHFFPSDNLVWVPLSVTHGQDFEDTTNKVYQM